MTASPTSLLADGSTVHLRPISRTTPTRIVALHSRFSERTRYLRYFSPYPRIPARTWPGSSTSTTATARRSWSAPATSSSRSAGTSGWARGPDAEVAFVVEDAHQGRGIGRCCCEHWAGGAGAGITRFVAEVLPGNLAMLRVFADAGLPGDVSVRRRRRARALPDHGPHRRGLRGRRAFDPRHRWSVAGQARSGGLRSAGVRLQPRAPGPAPAA